MAGNQVHFEVFVRRYPDSPWTLKMAADDRESALEVAMEMVDQREAAAARVMRETLDANTGEFHSLTILTVGAPERARKIKAPEPSEPLCVAPQDLYSCHARDKIGRLLETWLARRETTPFELLHRPDLVEQLEASRVEIQHAIQKIALPEAHARNCSVAAMTKSFESLVERAVERLLRDARKGLPKITPETFARIASQLATDPEGAYRLGCGVAMFLAPAQSWAEKVGLLIDLADAAPTQGPGRALALAVIAEPLEEIVGYEKGLNNIVGGHLDLGGRLAAMSRLAAADVIDALVKAEPSVAKVMPELSDRAQGLAKWLGGGGFLGVRAAIGQRILRELSGQRRLRPSDSAGEIDVIRGLAMALTAASGKLLPLDNVQAAFSSRSRRLVTRDFVETYLGEGASSLEEAEALIWLTENIIGGGNKREAGRWLHAQIFSLRFERESRGSHHPRTRLAELARLQRAVARCGLVEETYRPIQVKLGEVGGLVEADARLVSKTVKSTAPALNRLTLLLRLASGEVAPLGPAADRARVEALKLARQDNTRAELTVAPDRLDAIRDLLRHAALAA